MKANPHIPQIAARDAVMLLRPDLTPEEGYWLAHRATAWAAQAHREWFWNLPAPEEP